MSALTQDISYGSRLLLKNRAVSLVAILSIALGIGVNAIVFSWVDIVLLHPLPGVANQNELILVKSTTPEGNLIDSSYQDYRDLRDRSTLFAGFIAVKMRPFTLGEFGSSERVWAETVTGNFFDVLGVKPMLGRTFNLSEQDERIGAHPVTVLSERLWRRSFNSDPAILGRTIQINHQPLTVIGVVNSEFRGTMNGLNYDLWIPITMRPQLSGEGNWLDSRSSRPLQLFARLRPGVTVTQAQAELTAIATRLGEQFPRTNRGIGARAVTLWDAPDGATSIMRGMLEVLLAVGGVVLLIVCANVANLLLARSIARQKEFAIRLGLGAGRTRLLRQLLTESFLLAALGAATGLVLATWLSESLDTFIPPTDMPAALSPHVGGVVMAWTTALAFLTTILCGIAPALHAVRADVNEALKAGGRGTSSAGSAVRLRGFLVVGEVALAVVALVGAGLFIQSFRNSTKANPGFDASHLLLAGVDLSTNRYTREQNMDILHRATERLESLHGVEGVAMSEDVPLGLGGRSWEDVDVEGYVPRTGENMKVWRNVVSPGYFSVLRIPLLDGREFTKLDTRDSQPVVIVNQTFVRRFLKGQNPIGHKMRAWGRTNTIIGVAKDGKYLNLNESPLPYFYLPLEQIYNTSMAIAVQARTSGPPAQLLGTVRRELTALDPGVGTPILTTMPEFLAGSYFAQRVGATLLSVLGLIALVLAAVGLYGVMSYTIGQRTHELGIRMALGASPLMVLRSVLASGMTLALTGIAAGLALCAALNRLASGVLYHVSGTDPATFAAVAAFLALVAAAASLVPARRATRIDPVKALSNE